MHFLSMYVSMFLRMDVCMYVDIVVKGISRSLSLSLALPPSLTLYLSLSLSVIIYIYIYIYIWTVYLGL